MSRPETRYRLICFVCEGGAVTMAHEEGTRTFGDIFAARPAACRFAVMQRDEGDYIVTDLFEAVLTKTGRMNVKAAMIASAVALGKHQIVTDVDTAIMAARLWM